MFWALCGPKNSNFGDLIGPWLYEKITGKKPTHVTNKELLGYSKSVLMTCGSLLRPKHTRKFVSVWGSGIIKRNEIFDQKPKAVFAVRGPLSREALMNNGIKCPEVYGDPGILTPLFHKAQKTHSQKIGIIPHYVCYPQVVQLFESRPDIKVIDVDRPVEDVLNDIASCDVNFSSSLHGIIISHAYKVPCQWMQTFDERALYGDDVKFHDYYMSIGRKDREAVPMKFTSLVNQSTDQLIQTGRNSLSPIQMPDPQALLQACPY